MIDFIEKWSARVLVWALCRQAEGRNWDLQVARRVANREVRAISETIGAAACWHKSETEILTERLGRRYDLGMALSESANRAIAQKQAARDPQLTERQKMALKVQEETLQRIVARS